MSLKFMASKSWRITYEGTMEWSEQTGQFGDHGRLFERVVSFEDIPSLEFEQKQSQEHHINKVHLNVKPYECNFCKKAFFIENHLKTHLKASHKKEAK